MQNNNVTAPVAAINTMVIDSTTRDQLIQKAGIKPLADCQRETVLSVVVVLDGILSESQYYDLQFGSIQFECQGREYALDTKSESFTPDPETQTTHCKMFLDDDCRDIFTDNAFDLLLQDLLDPTLSAEMWIDGLGDTGDDCIMPIILSMSLGIEIDEQIIEIDLSEDNNNKYQHLFYLATVRYTDEDENREGLLFCTLEEDEMIANGYMQASRYCDEDIFHYGVSVREAQDSIGKESADEFVIISVEQ